MTKACEECNGTGLQRRWLFFKSPCWNCGGTGREFDIIGTLTEIRDDHAERKRRIEETIRAGSRISQIKDSDGAA